MGKLRDEMIRTGLPSTEYWQKNNDRKFNMKEAVSGRNLKLPEPLRKRPAAWPKPKSRKKKDGDEQVYVQTPNVAFMKQVCAELVVIDVGFLGSGSYRGTGLPDSFGSCKGRAFYCEFKAPGGKGPTPAQMDHLLRYQKEGHVAMIVATTFGFRDWYEGKDPVGYVETIPVY